MKSQSPGSERPMNSRPAFRLRLLGSPSIVASEGAVLTGPPSQRHRVALLALLARSHGRGLGREKVMAYLWPERDTEHAHRLLNQAVYHLRKSLGHAALISDVNELRLNPEVVDVDVVEFEAAAERGELARAVGLYTGPFLDGFFLRDGLEFDRWVARQAEGLALTYWKALEALAEGAEKNRDFGSAVELWRTRAAHDPFDSRITLRLVQALEASGNRAAALQHAELHERLLREELGMEAAPGLAAMGERLRGKLPRTATTVGAPDERHEAARVARDAQRRLYGSLDAPPPIIPLAPRPIARATWYVTAALVLGTLVFSAIWWDRDRRLPSRPPAEERSVVVLPLVNRSVDPADAVLAEGMTEELIAVLARTAGLRIIAGPSLFPNGNRQGGVRNIADSLGVAHILEGGLQKSGTRLHVQMRLVTARDGSTRWSEIYDRELRDIFAVQEDIARAVARELGLLLGASQGTRPRRQPTQSIAAYELYLRGNDRTLLRSDSAAREGLEYFRRAVALDSGYAGAWAGIGKMYARVAGAMPMPERERYFLLADSSARRAVTLDDSLAEAHAIMGVIRMTFFDFASAERHLTRAMALDPNNARFQEFGVTLALWTERPAQALAHAQRALALDPLSPTTHAEVARALLGNDRCDEAFVELEKLSALRPPLVRADFVAAQCYTREKRWPEALAALRLHAERGDPSALAQVGFALARAGRTGEALRIRDTLLARWRRGAGGAFEVAVVYVGFDEVAPALVWLERSVTDRSLVGSIHPFHGMIMGPLFENVRRHPGFEPLRGRLGLQKRPERPPASTRP